ncbi:MAG: rhomboid family intramembrane serine protease [Candidatus Aenigmatarchaeota archaeon]
MKFHWYAIILTIICIIIFVLQNLIPITEQFALVSADVLSRPWIIITHIFLHGSLEHLLFNMLALALFGSILEKIIGGKRFLIIFFISGIIAAIGSIMFYESSIGASGAIFGILGALGVLRPRMTVYLGYIPMPMAVAVIFWAIGDLVGLFAPDYVAHAAHLAGLIFGLAYGIYLMKDFGEKRIRKKREHLEEKVVRKWEDNYL